MAYQFATGSPIAYFSMEIALEPDVPTYSGGLGVLAGDTLRSAADMGVPMLAVSLLHWKGYFSQELDAQGNQVENPVAWNPHLKLHLLNPQITVCIDGRPVKVRAWRYALRGRTGHTVPVYLLDTALPENDAWDRTLTDHLYGGDQRYRLGQEAILGIGGVKMLRALEYPRHVMRAYHLNEGHAAFLCVALLEEEANARASMTCSREDVEAVRKRCVFTTHTPVQAGHDQFPEEMVRNMLGSSQSWWPALQDTLHDGVLNMTSLALHFSHYVNGVAMRHGEISRGMFPGYPISSITNGVHADTWVSDPFQALFDRHIPTWREDNQYLRHAVDVPPDEIAKAHTDAKLALLAEVEKRTGQRLNPNAMTIGFARRATPYKRMDLVFSDRDRLLRIVRSVGPLQFVFAGKAHPRDQAGKDLIRMVFRMAEELEGAVPIVYLKDYDMTIARYLCSGADIWLNTPQKPQEASGTSGMKAALNGVPSFSVLDGWWVEGHVEGVTGWAIGDSSPIDGDRSAEVASLYDKLENVILPMFYKDENRFAQVRRSAIALNGSFFNTQRMLQQYLRHAYPAEVVPQIRS